MITKSNLNKTVSFLQEFIAEVQLGLHVSELSEDDFESLVKDERSILNWLSKFGHFLSEDSFHLGFRLYENAKIDGAVLGIYATNDGTLHIFLIESFVRYQDQHSLKGNLITLVVIAATFFLSEYPESKGVYIVEPHDDLVLHYKKFGFELLENDMVMYATIETLQSVQLSLKNKVQ